MVQTSGTEITALPLKTHCGRCGRVFVNMTVNCSIPSSSSCFCAQQSDPKLIFSLFSLLCAGWSENFMNSVNSHTTSRERKSWTFAKWCSKQYLTTSRPPLQGRQEGREGNWSFMLSENKAISSQNSWPYKQVPRAEAIDEQILQCLILIEMNLQHQQDHFHNNDYIKLHLAWCAVPCYTKFQTVNAPSACCQARCALLMFKAATSEICLANVFIKTYYVF